MLWLKRNNYWNEIITCQISSEKILYGDYYYEDDEDGLKVKATVYRRLKDEKIEAEFNYTKLNTMTSTEDYRKLLLEFEKTLNTGTLFDRKIFQGDGY